MDIVTMIWAITSGSIGALAAVWLARILPPGEQHISMVIALAIGSVAGFIGGLISGVFDLDDGEGREWWAFGLSVALSMIAVLLYTRWKQNMMHGLLTPKGGGANAKGKQPNVAQTPKTVDQPEKEDKNHHSLIKTGAATAMTVGAVSALTGDDEKEAKASSDEASMQSSDKSGVDDKTPEGSGVHTKVVAKPFVPGQKKGDDGDEVAAETEPIDGTEVMVDASKDSSASTTSDQEDDDGESDDDKKPTGMVKSVKTVNKVSHPSKKSDG